MGQLSLTLVDAPHVPGGGVIADLTIPTGITATLSVADPHTVSFSVDGLHPEAQLSPVGSSAGVWVAYTDVLLYCSDSSGTNLVQRFRLNQAQDSYNVDGPSYGVTFSGLCYKGMCQSRVIGEDPSDFSSVAASGTTTGTVTGSATDANGNPVRKYAAGIDVANVVWDLINVMQSGTGRTANASFGITKSTVGFTSGAGNTGILTPTGGIAIGVGTSFFDAINQVLAGGDPTNGVLPTGQQAGADWDIDGNLGLRVWPKTNTSQGMHSANYVPASPFVMDAPTGNITALSRTFDTASYANFAITAGTSSGSSTGSSTNAKLTTQNVKVTNLATATEGWWTRFSSVQAASQTILNQVGAFNLANTNSLSGSYQVTLDPQQWVFTDCGVGDLVHLYVAVGPRAINAAYRVTSMTFTSNDDSPNDPVTFTLGRPDPHDPSQWVKKNIFDRLADLERRS